jgi:hypothetical protein
VAYRADIEIAVRGAQDLKRLQNEISATSKLINNLNSYIENIGSGGVVRNISNLQDTVQKAANAFNAAALNTEEATIAAKKYIDATADLNAGLRERQALLKSINEEERKTRLAAIGREVGGRASSGYAGPIGPGEASPIGALVGQKSPVAERVQRTIQARQDELQLQQALLRLEEKSAGELNKKVQSQEALVQGTREVLNLIQQQADKTKFLAGKSGSAVQGPLPPLAAAGAMGFPVALSRTKAEQASLNLEAKKQEILRRMVSTRQELSGLAENLQRLDQNTAVAIADAARAQERLNNAKEKGLRISKQGALVSGSFSPIGGAENIPGSPAARRAQAARRREALSNAVIGGAFPLLFGQGPGAALGGGLGGAGGGLAGGQFGFGLSLVGTALGAAVDTFTQAAIESGKSLNDPIKNFQKLADAGLLASRSQQQYIERLIEAGRVTEAAAIIQDEVIKKIGVSGLKDLQAAGAASDRLNKAFAEFSLQAQAAVAGPLAEILTWLTGVVAIGNTVNRQAAQQTDILQGLSEADRRSLQQQEQQILQGANIFNEAQKRQQVQGLYQRFASRSNVQRPGVSTDLTPQRQAAGQTQELQAQVALEAKKLSLVGMSLEKNGQAYVEAAKAVALQEYENKLLEIKNSWIGKAFDIERNQAMIRLANLQYAGKLKAIDAERVKTGRDELDIRRAILGLQSDLIRTTLEAGDLDIEYTKVTKGQAAAIGEEIKQLQARLDLEARTLDLRFQQQLLVKDLTAQERSLIETIYKEQLKNLTQQYTTRQQILIQSEAQLLLDKALADAEAVRQARQPFEDLRRNKELEIQYGKTYLRLVTEGVLPAEAERIANFERLVSEQLTALDNQIAISQAALVQAEAYGVSADRIKELREELERLNKARGAVVDEATKGPGEGAKPGDRITEAVATARGELNELLDLENQVVAAAAAIGDAFQQAFRGLVSGAMTGQQALAAFFKGVGDHFMDMASKMIAKLIEIYILETVLGFITGAVGGGGGGSVVQGVDVPAAQMPAGMAFAEGGFVTGPTRALIGEGGEPEYVIPASKMRTAMGRYSAGARGSSVIPGSGEQATAGTSGGATTMQPIDVRYTVERINSVDYVTADQFQAGMRQAASQGAKQGEQLAMRRLQQSASTRSRLGI